MKMSKELDSLTDKAFDFPNLDSRFLALDNYVATLDEFISVTCDQTEIRLKAKISNIKDPVSKGEFDSDLEHLSTIGKLDFSHTICGSVLVSIYFSYEASIINIFNHLSKKNSLITFESYKKKNKKYFQSKYEKTNFLIFSQSYSKKILNIEVMSEEKSLNFLDELRMLRNSYVHGACLISKLSDNLQEKIKNKEYNKIFGNSDDHWHITPFGVSIFFKEVYRIFKVFERESFKSIVA